MPSDKMLLLSIRPKYAERIFTGTKTVELRRIRPKIMESNIVLIYVTSPVKSFSGVCKVEKILSEKPNNLWHLIKNRAGVSREEFDNYYKGANEAFAISFNKVWELKKPIELNKIKRHIPNFKPPQGYWYINEYNSVLNIFISFIRKNGDVSIFLEFKGGQGKRRYL